MYYLMGQIFKKLGDKHKSMIHFSWAYDLDPKGSTIIKEAIEMNQYDDAESSILAE